MTNLLRRIPSPYWLIPFQACVTCLTLEQIESHGLLIDLSPYSLHAPERGNPSMKNLSHCESYLQQRVADEIAGSTVRF